MYDHLITCRTLEDKGNLLSEVWADSEHGGRLKISCGASRKARLAFGFPSTAGGGRDNSG